MTQNIIITVGKTDRPTRPYDFNKGDRRFHDHQAALDHAEHKARATGVRQTVRIDPGSPFEPLYLVQDVVEAPSIAESMQRTVLRAFDHVSRV